MLLVTQLIQSKGKVIVIKGNGASIKTKTEVAVTNDFDTLVVTPAYESITLEVTVRDIYGSILSKDVVPSIVTNSYTISIPEKPEGCIFEIKDEKGSAYCSYEE